MGRRDSPPDQRGGGTRQRLRTRTFKAQQSRRTSQSRLNQLSQAEATKQRFASISALAAARQTLDEATQQSLRDQSGSERLAAASQQLADKAALSKQEQDKLYSALVAKQNEGLPSTEGLFVTEDMKAQLREQGALRAQQVQEQLISIAIQRVADSSKARIQQQVDLSVAQKEAAMKAQEARARDVILNYVKATATTIDSTTQAAMKQVLDMIGEAQAQVQQDTATPAAQIAVVDGQVSQFRQAVNETVNALVNDIISRANNYDTYLTQRKQLQDQATAISAAVSGLNTELALANKQLEGLAGKIGTLETSIKGLGDALEARKGEVASVNSQLANLPTFDAEALRTRLTTKQGEINAAIAAIEADLRTKSKELADANTAIQESITERNNAIRDKAVALADAVRLANADAGSLSGLLATARTRYEGAVAMTYTTIDGQRKANRAQRETADTAFDQTNTQHLVRLQTAYDTYMRTTFNPADKSLSDAKTELESALEAFSKLDKLTSGERTLLEQVQTALNTGMPSKTANLLFLEAQVNTLQQNLQITYPGLITTANGKITTSLSVVTAYEPMVSPTSAAATAVQRAYDPAVKAQEGYDMITTSLNNMFKIISDKVNEGMQLESTRTGLLLDRQVPRAAIKQLFVAQQAFNAQQRGAKQTEKTGAASAASSAATSARARPAGLAQNVAFIASKRVTESGLQGSIATLNNTTIPAIDTTSMIQPKNSAADTLRIRINPQVTTANTNLSTEGGTKTTLESNLETNGASKKAASDALAGLQDTASGSLTTTGADLTTVLENRGTDLGTKSTLETTTLPQARQDTITKDGQYTTALGARTTILGQRATDVTTAESALADAKTIRDNAAAYLPTTEAEITSADSAHTTYSDAVSSGATILSGKGTAVQNAETAVQTASDTLEATSGLRSKEQEKIPGLEAPIATVPTAPAKSETLITAEQQDGPLETSVKNFSDKVGEIRTELDTLTATTIPAKEGEVSDADAANTAAQGIVSQVSGQLNTATSVRTTADSNLTAATTSHDAKIQEKTDITLDQAVAQQTRSDLMSRLSIKNFMQSAYALYMTIKSNMSIEMDTSRGDKQTASIDKTNNNEDASNAATAARAQAVAPLQLTLATKQQEKKDAEAALDTTVTTSIPGARTELNTASDTLGGLVAPVAPTIPSISDAQATESSLNGQLDTLQNETIPSAQSAIESATTPVDSIGGRLAKASQALSDTLSGRDVDTTTLSGLSISDAQSATAKAKENLDGAEASRPTLTTSEAAASALESAQATVKTAGDALPAATQAAQEAETAHTTAADQLKTAKDTLAPIQSNLATLEASLQSQYPGLQITFNAQQKASEDAQNAYEVFIGLNEVSAPLKTELLKSLEQNDLTLAQLVSDALRPLNQTLQQLAIKNGQISILTTQINTSTKVIADTPGQLEVLDRKIGDSYDILWNLGYKWDSTDIAIQEKIDQRSDVVEKSEQAADTKSMLTRLLGYVKSNTLASITATRTYYANAMAAQKAARLAANERKIQSKINAAQYRPSALMNTLITTRDGKIIQEQSLMDTTGIDATIKALRDSFDTILSARDTAAGTLQLVLKSANDTTTYLTLDSSFATKISNELDTARSARANLSPLIESNDAAVRALWQRLTDSSADLNKVLNNRIDDLSDIERLFTKLGIAKKETESKEGGYKEALAQPDLIPSQLSKPIDEAMKTVDNMSDALDRAFADYKNTMAGLQSIDTSKLTSEHQVGDSTFMGFGDGMAAAVTLMETIQNSIQTVGDTFNKVKPEVSVFLAKEPKKPERDPFLANEDARLRGILDALEKKIALLQQQFNEIAETINASETSTKELKDKVNGMNSMLNYLRDALRIAKENRDAAEKALNDANSERNGYESLRNTYLQLNTSLNNIRSILEGYLGTIQGRQSQKAYLAGMRDYFLTQMGLNKGLKEAAQTTKEQESGLAKKEAEKVNSELNAILYLQDLLSKKIAEKDQKLAELAAIGDAMEFARNLRDKAELEKLNDIFGRLKDALAKVQEAQRLYDKNEQRIRELEASIELQTKLNNETKDALERLRKELEMRYAIRKDLQEKLENAKRELRQNRDELNRLIRENQALDGWKKSFKLPGVAIPFVQVIAGLGVAAAGILTAMLPSFFSVDTGLGDEEEEDKCAAVRQQGARDGLARGKTDGFQEGKMAAAKEYRRLKALDTQRRAAERLTARSTEDDVEPDEEALENMDEENAVDELQTGGQDEEGLENGEYAENDEGEEGEDEEPEEETQPFDSPFDPTVAPPSPDTVPSIPPASIRISVPPAIVPECVEEYKTAYRDAYITGREQTYISGWESFNPTSDLDLLGAEAEAEVEDEAEVEEDDLEPEDEEVEPDLEDQEGGWAIVNGEAEPLE